MNNHKLNRTTPRREFLGVFTAGVTTLSATTLAAPLDAEAKTNHPVEVNLDNPDAWFDGIKGKHKVVFDATRPHEILPFAWPRVFLSSHVKTGTPEKDVSIVVVLRHTAIPYAFEDRLWAKYNFGAVFKADDPSTKAPAMRNPFWQPKPGDFVLPGIGEVAIGINQLQASGVMFCVCDTAITAYSAALAQGMNLNPADVKKEWMSGLLPGIQLVPAGIWALGRAQEKGCSYIFAG
ncbi:MAG: hypothetical protein U0Y10_11910 [Spirosomataceae bacterium]